MSARRWLVTGAGSGIGLELVKQLLQRGDFVLGTSRDLTNLEMLLREYPGTLILYPLDMTDRAAIGGAVDAAVAAWGGFDVVVSNAGYALLGAAEEVSDVEIEHQLATNLLGPIHLIRSALPHFRTQKSGWIVQMSSEAGQTSLPSLSLYHASKWGIEGFCEAVAEETAEFGIFVTIVCPGRVKTGFDANAVVAQTIESYKQTSSGNLRRLLAMGRIASMGDPLKVAAAIIAEGDRRTPRRRLILGSDAWRHVHAALSSRVRLVESQENEAERTDIQHDDKGGP